MKGKKVFRLSRRAYIFAAAAVVIILAVLSVLFAVENNGEIALYYSPARNGAVIISDGENTGNTIPGKGISCVRYNADSTAAAVLMSDGASYSLYKVKYGKAKKLADNCTSEIVYSYEKNHIVYRNTDGVLYRDKTKIDDSVISFAVSTDAASVAYVKVVDNTNKLFVSTKGKITEIGEGYTPVAVSSEGEDIYVVTADRSFCILNPDGTMKSKLSSGVLENSFVFSEDFTTVIFSDGEYTYQSVEGKTRIRLAEGNAKPVSEKTVELRLDSAGNSVIMNSTLVEEFYCADNGDGTFSLTYIDKDCARKDIVNQARKYIITDDDMLSYLDTQGRIYAYNGNDNELVISGAVDFQATEKNRYIYYMTSAGEVYSVKGVNNQLIAKGAYRFYMNADNTLYLIMTDRKLYCVDGTRRSDVLAENVNSCAKKGSFFCYMADFNSDVGTYDVYYAQNNKKFSLVAEDVIK